MLSIVLTFISLLSSGHHQKNSHQQLHKEYTAFYTAEEKANFIVKKAFYIDDDKLLHIV